MQSDTPISGSVRERPAPPIALLAFPGFEAEFNPYTKLLYAGMHANVAVSDFTLWRLLTRRYDIIHLHWPEALLGGTQVGALARLALFMCGISRSRQRGAQLVITVHNAQPHESDKRWLRRRLARYLSSRVAGYVHLSYASVGMLGHGGYRVLVAPHGVYPPVDRPSSLSVAFEPFEPRLKSSHNAVLWFGRIRSYKGIEDLVSIRGEQSGWDLWITGYPDDQDLAERLAFAARYDPGIHLRLSHVPEEDLDTIISSSRLVCLPYNRVLNSGAAMRALSLHVPVLLPWSETFEELRRDVGEGWVNLYRGRLNQEAVAHALAAKRDHSPDLARYEWRQIADSHLAFYQELLSGDARQ